MTNTLMTAINKKAAPGSIAIAPGAATSKEEDLPR